MYRFTGGRYLLSVRYAGIADGRIYLSDKDGNNLTGSILLPATGGWQTWTTTTVPLTLPAGVATYYVEEETGGFNLNYLDIASTTLTNRATGGTATASSAPIGGEAAQYAFDGNTNTKWLGNTTASNPAAYLQYQFGGGTAYAITQYTLTSANDDFGRDPKTWQLCGSNDGANWATLDLQSNQSFGGRFVTKTYKIRNATTYKYYHLKIIANSGSTETGLGGSGLVQIAEMQLLN